MQFSVPSADQGNFGPEERSCLSHTVALVAVLAPIHSVVLAKPSPLFPILPSIRLGT